MTDAAGDARRAVRWPYLLLAYLCVFLALLGVLLPGLPTTPFLLVAAWAANRGSHRIHAWLYGHRYFGPLLHDWDAQGAVPTRAKVAGVLLMGLSWGIMAMLTDGVTVPLATGVLFLLVGMYLITRPRPGTAPAKSVAAEDHAA